MTDAPLFPEGVGKSSEELDTFLDELAPGDTRNARRTTGNPTSGSAAQAATSGASTTPPEGTGHASDRGQDAMSSAKSRVEDAASGAQDAMSSMKDRMGEAGSQAQDKTDAGMDRAAGEIGKAADALRQRGEGQSGAMGTAATTTADKLDSASAYLREKDTDQLLQDIESLIRRKPVESLLVAAGAGFVLSRIFG